MYVAPVSGAFSHGDHGKELRLLKFDIIVIIIIIFIIIFIIIIF